MKRSRSSYRLAVLALAMLLVACGGGVDLPEKPTDISPLLIGEAAPGFTLKDARGKPYHFDPAALEQPVVLVFYRGGWCPYCSAHLMDLRKAEQSLVGMGYQLLFASPDKVEKLAESIAEGDLNYTLLSDNELAVARAYGIAYRVDDDTLARYQEHDIDLELASGQQHHGLPVPSVFIIGTDGVIHFEYINPDYKVRISGPLLIAAAEAALGKK